MQSDIDSEPDILQNSWLTLYKVQAKINEGAGYNDLNTSSSDWRNSQLGMKAFW